MPLFSSQKQSPYMENYWRSLQGASPEQQLGSAIGLMLTGLVNPEAFQSPKQMEMEFMNQFGKNVDWNDPAALMNLSQQAMDYGLTDLAGNLYGEGINTSRALAKERAKAAKVASPGSPLTRELISAAELIQIDPDLTSAGFSKLGLDDQELKAASKEVASRAKQIQKQMAAEGTSMAYTEAEQLALDMMKQEGKFTPKEHLFGAFSSLDYSPQTTRMQPGEQREVVERRTKDGKIGLFDSNTKEFIGYK